MISMIGLRECFNDTQFQVKSDRTLKERTKKMQAGTQLYLDNFVSVTGNRKRETLEVSVVEDTTFSCAGKLAESGGKTAVLNIYSWRWGEEWSNGAGGMSLPQQ